MAIRLLFPLIFLGLCFCSKADETKGLDDDTDKDISSLQVAQSAEILGALGDIQYLVRDLGERQIFSEFEVDRSLQRRRLKESMELEDCNVADQGSLEDGEFQLQITGGGCNARMQYFQRRRVLTDTTTARVELMQFRSRFDRRRSSVSSEIKDFEMSGEYRDIFEKDAEVSTWKQELDMTLSGQARRLGRFEYRLEEKWLESKKGDDKRLAIARRTDRFLVSNDFKVTLVRVGRYLDGTLEGRDFRLNTLPITESEYMDVMQDFHNQWGVESLERR